MTVIYKFELRTVTTLQLPRSAVVRAVAWQGMGIHMWIELDPDKEPVHRKFVVAATGEPTPTGGAYVGSAISNLLVFHVYEV